jgi:hypothetical protein
MATDKPMFPATPGYGNLVPGAAKVAVPYNSYGQRRFIELEPIFQTNTSSSAASHMYMAIRGTSAAASSAIVGYKCKYQDHEFTILPISGYGPSPSPGQVISSLRGSPKLLPAVPKDRYLIHFKEAVAHGIYTPSGQTSTTTLEFTDNVGTKIISWPNPIFKFQGDGLDKSKLYWEINPTNTQLPDIIVDDIKRDGQGLVGAHVLKQADDRIAKQEAELQELRARVAGYASLSTFNAPPKPVNRNVVRITDQLIAAVGENRINDVAFLLEKGANANSKNSTGVSVLGIAQQRGYASIVRLLQEHGARDATTSSSSSAAPLGGGGSMRRRKLSQRHRKNSRRTRRQH